MRSVVDVDLKQILPTAMDGWGLWVKCLYLWLGMGAFFLKCLHLFFSYLRFAILDSSACHLCASEA